MATPKENLPNEFNGDFLDSEIDRLFTSARIRVEQQRIHIQELAGNLPERTRARHQLKSMLERCKELRAIRKKLAD